MSGLNETSTATFDQVIKRMAAYVGWLLLLSAAGFYVYGIAKAITESFSEEISYHPYLITTIGSLQALLLANLGAVLGITVTKPTSNIGRALAFGHGAAAVQPPAPMEVREKVQLFALALYVLSLVCCLVTWVIKDFSINQDEIVSIIPESGKMFIAVVLAYATAIFSQSQ